MIITADWLIPGDGRTVLERQAVALSEKDGQILVELDVTNTKTPVETPSVPQTGDNPGRPLALLILCVAAAGAFVGITVYRRKKAKAVDQDIEPAGTKEEETSGEKKETQD